MSTVSPQHRSVLALQADGWMVEVVERINRVGKLVWRKDLWGWADLLAIRRGAVLAVQVTSASNVAARIRKIADSDTVGTVREAGIAIEVHGWRKSANGSWVCRREVLS